MEELLLKGEVYCRLKTLEKQFEDLLTNTFPTRGSGALCSLLIKIIKRIQSRFHLYSPEHVKYICMLSSHFEEWCGYLYESRISNVPWSIIPTLEEIFANLKTDFQFAICPIWESNYKILNRNVVDLLKDNVGIPNLLFDASEKNVFSKEVNCFFEGYPKGIYFIFFPKMEKLSALHFALLGHEIGHIWAREWSTTRFTGFAKEHGLEEKFTKIATEEYKKSKPGSIGGNDIFEASFVMAMCNEYLKISNKILCEIVSDIYGISLFGESAIVAWYLFTQRSDIDSTEGFAEGYLSDRYRILLQSQALEFIHSSTKSSKIASKWNGLIKNCISAPIQDGKTNSYIRILLEEIEKAKVGLFEHIVQDAGVQLFTNYIKESSVTSVFQRLERNLTPNSSINEDLIETPIDFRNILLGTCNFLIHDIPIDIAEYEKRSRVVNLLSIKGIELSTEHSRYLNDVNKKRTTA